MGFSLPPGENKAQTDDKEDGKKGKAGRLSGAECCIKDTFR